MFYERNKVLTMLEQKKIPLGIQCFTGNTALIFDFVMFDAEHSDNNARATLLARRAARNSRNCHQ